MIRNIRRYGRAFALALKFTLRGEKPPLLRVRDQYPELAAWWVRSIVLVESVERAAAAAGVDVGAVTIKVDRRNLSMKTALETVRFHAERDYPYLIAHNEQYDQMALQAINLNDRYLITQLSQTVNASIKKNVDDLGGHLANLPTPTGHSS
ncbi:MAG: hypothetical protein ABI835_05720 [Chloroflexota bacterium]